MTCYLSVQTEKWFHWKLSRCSEEDSSIRDIVLRKKCGHWDLLMKKDAWTWKTDILKPGQIRAKFWATISCRNTHDQTFFWKRPFLVSPTSSVGPVQCPHTDGHVKSLKVLKEDLPRWIVWRLVKLYDICIKFRHVSTVFALFVPEINLNWSYSYIAIYTSCSFSDNSLTFSTHVHLIKFTDFSGMRLGFTTRS